MPLRLRSRRQLAAQNWRPRPRCRCRRPSPAPIRDRRPDHGHRPPAHAAREIEVVDAHVEQHAPLPGLRTPGSAKRIARGRRTPAACRCALLDLLLRRGVAGVEPRMNPSGEHPRTRDAAASPRPRPARSTAAFAERRLLPRRATNTRSRCVRQADDDEGVDRRIVDERERVGVVPGRRTRRDLLPPPPPDRRSPQPGFRMRLAKVAA